MLSLALAGFAVASLPSAFASRASSYNQSHYQECRVLPGDAAWPPKNHWDGLNTTVNGRLIASVPLGAACHDPHYNEERCNYLRKNWAYPITFEDNPVTPMSYWFQNSTCDPWTDRKSPCELGNLAVYSINVSSPADVAAGVKFAHENNIRLTIKNTGHDYTGKSVGQGSLGIWTHHLNSIEVNHNYSRPWHQGPAVKLGAGVRGYEAYKGAHDAGLRVVGGDCATVGIAGGFIQGGGHSPLSGAYGMASDNVLEWEVVLADGTFVTATPGQNEDLYWALAGAGPSTFGVVTAVTLRAFPDGPVGGAAVIFDRTEMSNDTFWQAFTYFQESLPGINAGGAQSAFATLPTQFYLQAVTRPDYTEAQMRDLMSNFTTKLDSLKIDYNLTITSLPTYLDHFVAYFGPAPWGPYVVGELMTGRLIPRAVSEASPAKVIDAYREITDTTQIIIGSTAQDVSVQPHRKPVAPNAVMPSWRTALQTLLIQSYYNSTISWDDKQHLQDQLVNFAQRRIDALVPEDTGTHLNEANFAASIDWKTQFYGTNYPRLLEIKHKYDPHSVFWAVTAVGSDALSVAPDGRLCEARW
ncbi:long-chain-fatty-acid-CoA ligase [Seiridium cupressi]